MRHKNNSPIPFGQDDVEVLEQKTVYHGFFRVHKAKLRHRLFQGGWSAVMEREIVDRGHAVVVLPYDPERDAIVMLEQFRVAAVTALGGVARHADMEEGSPWLLELVAGMIDPGESELEVARREMAEEAGLNAEQLSFAMRYLSSPGGLTERISIYIAKVDASTAANYGGLATEHEDIRVSVVPRLQMMEWLHEGLIDNAATVIALQWLQLHRTELLAAWQCTNKE